MLFGFTDGERKTLKRVGELVGTQDEGAGRVTSSQVRMMAVHGYRLIKKQAHHLERYLLPVWSGSHEG
jgi:hypothetical protein